MQTGSVNSLICHLEWYEYLLWPTLVHCAYSMLILGVCLLLVVVSYSSLCLGRRSLGFGQSWKLSLNGLFVMYVLNVFVVFLICDCAIK